MDKIMNKERYDSIIDRLNFLTRYYLNGIQYNKVYLKLSNGDDINISFPSNHIPHLLGVYTEKLKAASVVKNNTSAFDILSKMVNGYITDISIKNMHPGFNIASLFSDEIDRKIDSFLDIMKFRTDDIYCIIKYKADRTYTTGEATENSDYFIVRKHINLNTNAERYTVLGICKKEGTNEYVPVTTRLFNDYIELSKFLNERSKNQEITYVSVARIDNDYKNFHYKHYTELQEKKEYNKVLKDVACKSGAIPSTNADLVVIIERSLNNLQKNSNNSSILTVINECLRERTFIDKEEIKERLDYQDIPKDLDMLIDTCNDVICSSFSNDESVNNSYSSIQNENISLKEELMMLKQQLAEVQEQANSLKSENESLTEEKDTYQRKLTVLTDAFEKIR